MRNKSLISNDKKKLFQTAVLPFFFVKWQDAGVNRFKLEKALLDLAGFSTLREFLEYISPQTVSVFFHGGLGLRWRESLKNESNTDLIKKFNIDINKPRGLVSVDNYLPGVPGEKTAIAVYNIYAISRLSDNLVVIHGNGQEEWFRKEIINPLKVSDKALFVKQELDFDSNKPLGHGDALIQLISKERNKRIMNILSKAKYVITQFEGLPSRRSTAELSLLAMYVMDKYWRKISWLSPTCVLDTSRYPFLMDKFGRVTNLGHGKLKGEESITAIGENTPNNIGLHIIKTADLLPLLFQIEKKVVQKSYKELFSNSQTGELALDHLMEIFIRRKRLLIFNIAKPYELQNEVKTVDKLNEFISDMRKITIEEFEPKASTVSEIEDHMKHLSKIIVNNPHNIILLDPDPLTKGIGAGHSRQIHMMKMYLENCGIGKKVTHLIMSEIGKSGFLSIAALKMYKHIQSHPFLAGVISNFLNRLSKNESVDKDLVKSDYSSEVMEKLKKLVSFNPRLPTIIITTHVIETVTAIKLLQKKMIKGAVFEFIPDPFPPPLQLQTMSSPITHKGHFIVVHDSYTMDNLLGVRKGIAKEANVFPLGTLSNYNFLLSRKGVSNNIPLHIGIESGGNYLPQYDQKVFEFIKANTQSIINGELRITFHTMYHNKTYINLLNLLNNLNLKHGIKENVRIIYCGNVENPVGLAIESREKYLNGNLDKGWDSPRAVITKGSEVTLEHRGEMLMAVVYGSGHEKLDAEAGFKERRAVNLFNLKPHNYLENIKKALIKRENLEIPKPPLSYAIFGLLKYLDSEYFHKKILPKIPGYERENI